MRVNMINALTGALLTLTATTAAAQSSVFDRSAFDAALNGATAAMAKLEHVTNEVETSAVLDDADGLALDTATEAYGASLFTAFQIAHEAAEQAANTNGQAGDGRLLAELEVVAERDETRAINVARRWERIHARINQGEIQQVGAGARLLSPAEEEQRRVVMGSLVRPGYADIARRAQQPRHQRALDSVWNALFPEVQAAQVLMCYGPCAAQNWPACITCIVKAAPTVINAWNEFQSALSAAGPCKWYRPVACLKRLWALVKFLAVVA